MHTPWRRVDQYCLMATAPHDRHAPPSAPHIAPNAGAGWRPKRAGGGGAPKKIPVEVPPKGLDPPTPILRMRGLVVCGALRPGTQGSGQGVTLLERRTKGRPFTPRSGGPPFVGITIIQIGESAKNSALG